MGKRDKESPNLGKRRKQTLPVNAPNSDENCLLDAVIFDFDGILMDTDPLWMEAETHFAAMHGRAWTSEMGQQLIGLPFSATIEALKQHTQTGYSPAEIETWLVNLMVAEVQKQAAPWLPGIEDLIGALRAAQVPRALVTSVSRPIALAAVNRLDPHTFAVIITAEDVSCPKPDPQPYQVAIAALTNEAPGITAKRVVALEDSPSGIASALAAGTRTVGIPCVLPVEKRVGLSRVPSAACLDLALLCRIAAGEVVDLL